MIPSNYTELSNHEVEDWLKKELQLTPHQEEIMFFNDVIRASGFRFYKRRQRKPVGILWRLSMPLFFICSFILWALVPLNFLFSGQWFYLENGIILKAMQNWEHKLKLS